MSAQPRAKPSPDEFIPTRRSLLSRLRDLDDNTSWRDFFDTYWKLIFSTALKSGLSQADAEDVVQETLLTVARKLPDFRYDPARGSFKGWLLHTARWRILDHLRKQPPPAEAPSGDDPECDVLARIPDPAAARIEAAWEAEWQQNLVDAALERIKRKINPKHYQVFELYALKNWPAGKVARSLDVNLAQVHLIKHRVSSLVRKEVKRLEAQGI